jgi:hypothetical protein
MSVLIEDVAGNENVMDTVFYSGFAALPISEVQKLHGAAPFCSPPFFSKTLRP